MTPVPTNYVDKALNNRLHFQGQLSQEEHENVTFFSKWKSIKKSLSFLLPDTFILAGVKLLL